MPDKTYVSVANTSVKEAFDNKYKSSAPKLMKATLEKAINGSSKLTTKPPSDKNTERFYVDGRLISTKEEKGAMIVLKGDIKMLLATWPQKSLFAFPSGSAKVETSKSDNLDAAVKDLIEAILESVLDSSIKELEKRVP